MRRLPDKASAPPWVVAPCPAPARTALTLAPPREVARYLKKAL